MKRVLHVVGAMNRAGAESMLMTLYRCIDRDQLQFDFLEFSDEESDFSAEIVAMGGRIIKMHWSQSVKGLRRTILDLAKVMRAYGPYSAVHSHILFASGAVMMAARSANVPARIAHSHNTADGTSPGVLRRLYHCGARLAIRWGATSFVACGEEAGRYLFGARSSGSAIVIPNSVDIQRFSPVASAERIRLRRELGVPGDGLVLVSVARLEPVKNHEFLIHLANELKGRGVVFHLLFVGEGSLRARIEAQIQADSLTDVVRMLGLRGDVERILQCADALVMPSHFEGLPVVLVEMQAVGSRCLVSDNVTREADLGLNLIRFLPIDNPAVWADAIVQGLPPYRSSAEILKAFRDKGYSTEQALARLLPLYDLAEH